MIEVIFLFLIGFVWILFASIEDIRTREVANWISFSLVIFALGFRLFYSLFNSNFNLLYQGLIGFGIFLVLGNLLYYSRMFAGGDAKLMMALGAVLGFSFVFIENLKSYGLFFFLFLVSGAVYGLVMTFIISFRNFGKFRGAYKKNFWQNKNVVFLIMIVGIFIAVFGFMFSMFFTLGAIIFVFPYFYIYAKTVDNVCMVKTISTKDLTEGDWLFGNVKIGRKVIKPSWGGLSKEDIRQIRRRYRKIKVKYGIAFVPVFFIAYVVYFYFWLSGSFVPFI